MKYVTDLRPCSCSHCERLFTITVHKVINPRNGLDSVAHSSECLFLHKDQRLWTFVYAAFFHVIWFRCSVLSNKEIQCWAWSFLGFVRICLMKEGGAALRFKPCWRYATVICFSFLPADVSVALNFTCQFVLMVTVNLFFKVFHIAWECIKFQPWTWAWQCSIVGGRGLVCHRTPEMLIQR